MPIDIDNFSNDIEIVEVPAGVDQFRPFERGGERINVLESSAKFRLEIVFPSGRVVKLKVSGGYTIRTGTKTFSKLRIVNLSATQILTVELAVGTGDGTEGIEFDYLRQRSTRMRVTELASGGGSATFPGVATDAAGPGQRRKAIIVTNNDSDSDLVLVETTGNVVIAVVGRLSSFMLETDADIKVGNAGVDTIATVVELFFV